MVVWERWRSGEGKCCCGVSGVASCWCLAKEGLRGSGWVPFPVNQWSAVGKEHRGAADWHRFGAYLCMSQPLFLTSALASVIFLIVIVHLDEAEYLWRIFLAPTPKL